jgi:hypothetical protein
LERQQAAIFERPGGICAWEGVADPVRVIRREADESIRGDYSELIAGRTIRVRKSEVAAPAKASRCKSWTLTATRSPTLFEVDGEPQLDRRGVWHCPVKPPDAKEGFAMKITVHGWVQDNAGTYHKAGATLTVDDDGGEGCITAAAADALVKQRGQASARRPFQINAGPGRRERAFARDLRLACGSELSRVTKPRSTKKSRPAPKG